MLESENLNGTGTDPLRARFGMPAGTQPPEAERQQWEQLCRELLQEREQLRTELAATKAKCERYLLYLQAQSAEEINLTIEEVLAREGQEPTIEQLIAELEQEAAAESAKSPATLLEKPSFSERE